MTTIDPTQLRHYLVVSVHGSPISGDYAVTDTYIQAMDEPPLNMSSQSSRVEGAGWGSRHTVCLVFHISLLKWGTPKFLDSLGCLWTAIPTSAIHICVGRDRTPGKPI